MTGDTGISVHRNASDLSPRLVLICGRPDCTGRNSFRSGTDFADLQQWVTGHLAEHARHQKDWQEKVTTGRDM